MNHWNLFVGITKNQRICIRRGHWSYVTCLWGICVYSVCNACVCNLTSVWGCVCVLQASLMAQTVQNLPAMQETRVRHLGREDSLEKEMAAHSRILDSCLENGRASLWWVIVHRVAESWTWLSVFFDNLFYCIIRKLWSKISLCEVEKSIFFPAKQPFL